MTAFKSRIAGFLGQAALYAAFAAVIGAFADWPPYVALGADQAMIKLSVSHPGQRVEECRPLSREELAKLPPNMRAPRKCARERFPVRIALAIDGRTVLEVTARPAGLSRDGPSSVYRRIVVPAGSHVIAVSMSDRGGEGEWTHRRETTVGLPPARALVVGFREEDRSFFFR